MTLDEIRLIVDELIPKLENLRTTIVDMERDFKDMQNLISTNNPVASSMDIDTVRQTYSDIYAARYNALQLAIDELDENPLT